MYLENSKQSGSLGCIGGGFALLEKMKAFSKRIKQDSDSVSGTRQFLVLLHLMMKKILRNRIALWIQFIHHLMCGLMFGKYLSYEERCDDLEFVLVRFFRANFLQSCQSRRTNVRPPEVLHWLHTCDSLHSSNGADTKL